MARMPIQKYRIVGVKDENEYMKTWQLICVEGDNMQFRPGQFALVYLLDDEGNPLGEVRPYSMSSSPLKKDCLEFTIKMTPNFPEKLLKLGVGGVVGLAGPSGVFVLDEKLEEIVFIVGGVGVAGISSAVRYVCEKKLPIKITLFYSSSHEKEFIWMDEFWKLEKENSNFKFVPIVTRETPNGWRGETERVSVGMIRKYADTDKAMYYLCGSPEMVSGVEEMLKPIGVDRTRIKMEKWTGINSQ